MNQAASNIQFNSGSEPFGDLVTTGRLSQFLGCSERHIFNLRKRGLPAFEIGDMVRFDLAAVRRWLVTQKRDVAQPKSP